MEDLIGYDQIIENSMRNVIYEALQKVEKNGLPGNHHFVVSFSTKHPGVLIPQHLKEKFSEEMTIIIQRQFSSLVINKRYFEITLSFSGNSNKLVIPYNSITSFADPSINFGLKFSHYNEESKGTNTITKNNKAQNDEENKGKIVDLSAKVVSLDAFRKNKDEDSGGNE